MKEKKKSFVLYTDYADQVKTLPMEEIGRLFCAILDYADGVTDVELSPAASMAFAFIRQQMDRDRAKYEEVCEKRRDIGRRGGLKRVENEAKATKSNQLLAKATKSNQSQANQPDNENVTDNDTENDTDTVTDNVTDTIQEEGTHTFHPPSLEEVLSYCAERGNKADGEQFYHYYTANGWRTGGNPIQSWRALLRCWEKSPQQGSAGGQGSAPPAKKTRFTQYSTQRQEDDYDELEKRAIEQVKNFRKEEW